MALKSKNGKFLSEILPGEDQTEIKWKDKTIKVNPNEVQQFESVREIPLQHLTQSPAEIPWRIHKCG